MAILIKDNAYSTLASGISASDTAVTVQTGHGTARFPSYTTIYPTTGYDYSWAALEDVNHNVEYVKIINRTADIFTVQRAQLGSTALSFAAGSAFEIRNVSQAVIDLAVASAGLSSQVTGAAAKTTPVAADLFALIDSAASWVIKKVSWQNILDTLRATGLVWTTVQKSTVTTNNALTHDLSVEMDVFCTPTAGGTLTFTNIAAGQKFEMLFVNGSNYAIAKGSNIKCSSTLFTTISATGRYIIAGRCLDGTNVDLTVSGALS